MKIVVYGTGCKSCHALHESVLKLVKDNAIDAEVEYITDLNKIISKGIMQMPALEVDGKFKCMGRVPKDKELLIYFR
ncbi:MAG: thioredoxin family protein [Clostridia bacterium]|nr:thioredoxin family protein [Clostridia bacterium]